MPRLKSMRPVVLLLLLFAWPGPAAARLEFLTVDEIFQAISFVAAHPASPENYSTVSPFAPDSSETRMPETFAELATSILHCYHSTARFEAAVVAQTPWDHASRYGGDNSALIRIRYHDSGAGDPYEIHVGLVSRQDEIRTTVVGDSAPAHWNAACRLERWTRLAP
jgi:hypothetical protein